MSPDIKKLESYSPNKHFSILDKSSSHKLMERDTHQYNENMFAKKLRFNSPEKTGIPKEEYSLKKPQRKSSGHSSLGPSTPNRKRTDVAYYSPDIKEVKKD